MTRAVDHKDVRKHISAILNIRPLCRSKLVSTGSGEQTIRLLTEWNGRRIRVGLGIGEIVNGEARLSEIGMLCLEQWMRSHPSQTIVFAEFKHVSTGNTERMRGMLIERLDLMSKYGDNALLFLAARNSTMYDKIGALLGIGSKKDGRV